METLGLNVSYIPSQPLVHSSYTVSLYSFCFSSRFLSWEPPLRTLSSVKNCIYIDVGGGVRIKIRETTSIGQKGACSATEELAVCVAVNNVGNGGGYGGGEVRRKEKEGEKLGKKDR